MIAMDTAVKGLKSPKKLEDEQLEHTNSESDNNDGDVESSEVESRESSDEASDAGSENSNSPEDKTTCNPGWADVMQKILKTNKPKHKKTIVLSKAKKLADVKTKETAEPVPFEIETQEGEIKKELIVKEKIDEAEETSAKRRRKEIRLGIRVKPSIMDRERERTLQKIATKGVVQLFNVVQQQQAEIERKIVEVGPLERKKEQVLKSIDKRAFLDVLMGGSKSIPVDPETKDVKLPKKEENEDSKVWSVLRDDFVMGAKLKDWDKKAPEDEDSTSSEEMDSD